MRPDSTPIPHHRYPRCDPTNLIHPVADVENSHALGLEAANIFKKPVNLRFRERGGWFIKNEEPAALRERACNFDELLLTDSEPCCWRLWIKLIESHPSEGMPGLSLQFRIPNEAATPRKPIQKKILRHRECAEHVQLLEHHDHARFFRRALAGRRTRLPVQRHGAGVCAEQPREDACQRRFASAIATQKRMHLARLQLEIELVKNRHGVALV